MNHLYFEHFKSGASALFFVSFCYEKSTTMKLESLIRIYRHSYFGDSFFCTILMDYRPWKVCYSGELIRNQDYMDPKSLENVKEDNLLQLHNAVSEIDPSIYQFFHHEDILSWRRAEDVIPEYETKVIADGILFGLIWKKDNILKNIVYQEDSYPESISFPEYKKLESLINHMDGLRMKY